jgi:nicotinamide mononucleotide transporter
VSAIEWIAAIITLVSIWLATIENIWYWPTGLVSLVMYTWVYYQFQLYGEALLQVICFGLMLYGWYEWLHGGKNRDALPVTRTPRRAWPVLLGSGVAGTLIVAVLMDRYTNNPVPYRDAGILVFSLVAQLMTARKWIENWLFWVVINVISIALYLERKLYPTTLLYVALLILAVQGYRKWRRSLVSA